MKSDKNPFQTTNPKNKMEANPKKVTTAAQIDPRKELFSKLVELRNQIITESVTETPSTPHRMEVVAVHNGITYINDSRAINMDLTWFSLEQVQGKAVWIVGSLPENEDYTTLRDVVRGKVHTIICLGRNASRVFRTFLADVDLVIATSTAEEAVRAATVAARHGDTVILSPASPSHDLFDSYEDRGRKFVRAVLKITSEEHSK